MKQTRFLIIILLLVSCTGAKTVIPTQRLPGTTPFRATQASTETLPASATPSPSRTPTNTQPPPQPSRTPTATPQPSYTPTATIFLTPTITPPPPPDESIITTTILPIGGEICLNTKFIAGRFWEMLVTDELKTKHGIYNFVADYVVRDKYAGWPAGISYEEYPDDHLCLSLSPELPPSEYYIRYTFHVTYWTGNVSDDADSPSYYLKLKVLPPASADRGELIAFTERYKNIDIRIIPQEKYNSELFVMNADGSGLSQLTHIALDVVDPAWSPDGSRIAFIQQLSGVGVGLYTINADGSDLRLLVEGQKLYTFQWWPDGSRVLYQNSDGVFVINADGSGKVQFSAFPWEFCDISPDGQQVLYESYEYDEMSNYDSSHHVLFVSGQASPVKVLQADSPDLIRSATWAPDTQSIYVHATLSGQEGIYFVEPGGTGPVLLRSIQGMQRMTLSPDGARLAIEAFGILVMNSDGSGLRNLVEYGRLATWSPDGSQLAFIGNDSQMFVITLDDNGLLNLTGDQLRDYWYPAWQPSGQ